MKNRFWSIIRAQNGNSHFEQAIHKIECTNKIKIVPNHMSKKELHLTMTQIKANLFLVDLEPKIENFGKQCS